MLRIGPLSCYLNGIWPVCRFGSTAGYLLGKQVLKAGNYSTCIPAIWCWMLHPENVKTKQNKTKKRQWQQSSAVPCTVSSLWRGCHWHTWASEALPFLPYVGHCVERLRMNTAHQEVDSREKNRLLIKMILRLAQEKAIFEKKTRIWLVLKKMYIFQNIPLPFGSSLSVSSFFCFLGNAMPQLLRQQFAFTNCVYKQHTLVNIVIVQGLYLVGFWITSFYPLPCVFMYSV